MQTLLNAKHLTQIRNVRAKICTTYGNIKETAVKSYVIELSQNMRMASSYLLTMPYTMSQKMKLFCDPQKLSSSKHVLQVKTEKIVLIQP